MIMGKTKHEKSFVNYEQGYERNVIGMVGIVYFAIGIFLLMVVSFALMWALQNVMEDNVKLGDTKDPMGMTDKPMKMTDNERLPPEPRLQAAPGFGVETEKGRVNLELKPPQSEYRELRKMWEANWANGQVYVDEQSKTVVTMSINDAKAQLLEQNAGVAQPTSEALDKARMIISDSSAGRVASERRR